MKRTTLLSGLAATGAFALGAVPAIAADDRVRHTDAEWKRLLPPETYYVMRQAGTERAFSSPLDEEKRPGIYRCAGCNLPLYSSKTKFDSGTGWPSFWQPLPNAIATKQDATFGIPVTEVHCRRCEGHLGHVFDDGPKPTGLRYCMDGVALKFVPGPTTV